jgi:hypothetical protein
MKRITLVGCTVLLGLVPALGAAQTAKITAVVLDVKSRPSASATWTPARVGTQLGGGAQVRTGKRGKCEIRFPDGSIVRLAPLSDLTIARIAGKDLSVGYGKLYARIVKGTTARIQGGTGVASIKGTVLEFDAGDVKTPRERATNVLTIFDGLAELSGGGKTQQVGPGSQSRIGRDGLPEPLQGVPGQAFFGGMAGQWWEGLLRNANLQSTPASSAGLNQRDQTGPAHSPSLGAAGYYPLHSGSVSIDLQSVRRAAGAGTRVASLPLLSPEIALGVPPVTMLQTEPGEVFGRRFYDAQARVDLFGLASSDDSLAGVRVRPSVVWNDLYFELGGMSWARTGERLRTELSEAFVKARSSCGDLTIGRQHFVMGPVNNSNLGSIIGFDTADAIRFQPSVGPVRLDLGYVYDYMPLENDCLHGAYARAQTTLLGGTVGANMVYYGDVGTGVTLDFSVPALPGKLDVYGEIGSDPGEQHLHTFGCYFPSLYERYDVDLFAEYAHRDGIGSLYSARAYRNFENDWTLVLSLLASPEMDTVVSLGAIKQFH